MNFINILKGIEHLAVELLLWIIYVPKTIYKIIKNPNWVPGYIKLQLAKDDKFRAYMSPVLLFLAISVVLFVLLDSGLITSPDYDDNKGSFGDRLQGPMGLLFLALPLFFGLFIEIFRTGGLKRENLLQSLYVQCYFFSPLMLSFFAYLLADQFDWGYMTRDYINLAETPLYMFLLTLLWFIIVQVSYISRELKYSKWVSFGIHLFCYLIIGIGVGAFIELFVPPIVNKDGAGKEESIDIKISENGEYVVDVWNMTEVVLSDYTIHFLNKNKNTPSSIMLVHNQTTVDKIRENLKFTFNGNKGDHIVLKGSGSLLNPDGNLIFDAFINPNESLMFKYSDNPLEAPISTDVWEFEPLENNQGFLLYIDLPKTGQYTLIIKNEVPEKDTYFSLGFFKTDSYGMTENISKGKLIEGIMHEGKFMSDDKPIDSWTFTAKKNDEITLAIHPKEEHDLAFNVVNARQESVVPIDRTAVANIIHWLYVILFGYAIFIGYRAIFRKSEEAIVLNEHAGNKAGKVVSVIGLIILILMILILLLF